MQAVSTLLSGVELTEDECVLSRRSDGCAVCYWCEEEVEDPWADEWLSWESEWEWDWE